MAISNRLEMGRAKNAVLSHFERTLSVPKIYIDADWNGTPVDVLAINRDGSGDVHAVLLYSPTYKDDGYRNLEREPTALAEMLEKFANIPAQYKYVGAVHAFSKEDGLASAGKQGIPASFFEDSFASDGLGRVGHISIFAPALGEVVTSLDIKPERFRAFVGEIADEYIRNHSPDWEMRA